jgi:hypothetical protein
LNGKKIGDALEDMHVEKISDEYESYAAEQLAKAKKEERFSAEDIKKELYK